MKRPPKFVRDLQNQPNFNPPHPLKEFFLILLIGGGTLLLVYAGLGLAVDKVAIYMPENFDQALGKLYERNWPVDGPIRTEQKLQVVVDNLVTVSPELKGPYTVKIVKDDAHVNAFAIPGKKIAVTSALLQASPSENELAFVLAHELGHHYHRHHLRNLGRLVIFYALVAAAWGTDSDLAEGLGQAMIGAEMKFSQKQETEADLWGLEILNRRYGYVGGSLDFFNRMSAANRRSKAAYFFATHPHPEDRLRRIQEAIEEKGYSPYPQYRF
jgi:predicted Zn-dependent protease